VPGPDTAAGHDASAFQARLQAEVERQLTELRLEKREGELRVARTVSQVALECARVLDAMERRLPEEPSAGLRERLEALRARVYGSLAEALERSRNAAPARPEASWN
jgi:hypothetical protein